MEARGDGRYRSRVEGGVRYNDDDALLCGRFHLSDTSNHIAAVAD